MKGPMVYAQLLDRATKEPHEHIAKRIRQQLGEVEFNLSHSFTEMLREVYMAGVRDGFHEGLRAAADEVADSETEKIERGTKLEVAEARIQILRRALKNIYDIAPTKGDTHIQRLAREGLDSFGYDPRTIT